MKYISIFGATLFCIANVFADDIQQKEKDPSFTFTPKGTMRLDYLGVTNNKQAVKDRFYLRDLLVGGKGQIFYDFDYRVELDLLNDVFDKVEQAYVEYKKFDPIRVKVGRFNHSFFLDYDKSFNEWPAIGSLLIYENDGVQLKTHGDNWTVSGSYGSSEAVYNNAPENKRKAYYAQATYSPYHNTEKKEYVHLGASASYIIPKGQVLGYSIKPEVKANLNLINTGNIVSINDGRIGSVAAAYNKQSFSVQGEYLGYSLDRKTPQPDLFFHGGYAQVAYLLTGEDKEYIPSQGKIEAVNPKDPVFTFSNYKKFGIGAWEIACKYSTLNMNSKQKFGKLDTYGVGLNWYLNYNMKISNDFLLSKTDRNAAVANSTTKIALFRLDIDF